MAAIVKAAFAYTAPVFLVAFALGALRVTLVAPRIGPVPAVALEIPLMLALSWAVAGRVLRRWPQVARPPLCLLALALLLSAELATALALGGTSRRFPADMATPAGMLGLAGQIAFALIPILRRPASTGSC